jgi:anti-sigma B factor antagonist
VNLEVRDDPYGKIISITGMVTVDNCHLLVAMGNKLASEGQVNLVFDFSGVNFIDSAGIGTLVSISKSVKQGGGNLKLTRINENLRRVLTLSRLDKFFAIDDTSESDT